MGYRKRGIDGQELLEWVKSNCDIDHNECWLWNGALNDKGYGLTKYKGEPIKAHQLTYNLVGGVVKEGLELDHTCRVRRCCNPDHVEPTTHSENVKRGLLSSVSAKRYAEVTACPAGHPYSGTNLYINKEGHRYCRQCGREGQKRRRLKLQEVKDENK